MVVLAMGHERQCVHESDRLVVVAEAERLGDRVAVLDHLPAGNLGQQFAHARFAEPVFAPSAGDAVGLGEGNQVVHGARLLA